MRDLYRRARRILGRLMQSRDRRPVRSAARAIQRYAEAWQSDSIPERQWVIAESQLKRLETGDETPEFEIFLRAISAAVESGGLTIDTLLEVGCSSGYYSRVLQLKFPKIRYTGVDFSPSFISFGEEKFPDIDLQIGDTTNLQFPDDSFDVVVSGSVLLHVYEWKQAISESSRVARRALILHRTPVSSGPTSLFTKTAYGQKMIEWTFNEAELLECARGSGFGLLAKWPVYEGDVLKNDPSNPVQFTYVLVRS